MAHQRRRPEKHGYDESDGDTGNENAYKFHDPNPVDILRHDRPCSSVHGEKLESQKPFFIQLSWNALHAAENANKATLAKYEKLMTGENTKAIKNAAITEDLDTGVGKLLAAVDRLGLADNTYVIYMSITARAAVSEFSTAAKVACGKGHPGP